MTWQALPWQSSLQAAFTTIWGSGVSPIPSLDLNFISGSLDPRITYSGASLATLTDATGAIAYKPHNLALYSDDLTNGWSGATATAAPGTSRTGGNSTRVQLLSGEARHRGTAPGSTYAITSSVGCWLKSNTGSTQTVRLKNTHSGVLDYFSPDLTVTTTWQFFSFTQAFTAAAGDGTVLVGVTTNVAGTAADILVGEFQHNLGPLQPYYPTTSAAYYGPRFTYDPVTHAALGLLIEEQRTNLLLNSLIVGTNLSTQTVTVAAVANTLSFYGTGTVVLSGAYVGTLAGSGAYPTRSTLTFTPTAGSLIVTVTGTVQYAQLEAGGFATSFIPTAGASVTRAADSATMTGSNFSSWFNASAGAFVVEGTRHTGLTGVCIAYEAISAARGSGDIISADINDKWAYQSSGFATEAALSQSWTSGTLSKQAGSYSTNNFKACLNGGTVLTDSVGTVTAGINQLRIGDNGVGNHTLNAPIARLRYYNTALTNAQLQALTT